MRMPVLLALGTVPVLVAMCLGCSSPDRSRPRFDYALDIGDGWTAHVWSSQTEDARSVPEHDPDAPMVYCSLEHHGLKVVPIQWIDHDSGGAYQFEALRADNGRLVCVYEVNRYADYCSLAVLYDADSGECWRGAAANWRTDPAVAAKWRERFARVAREHPHFRVPTALLPDAPAR
ncbi:unnamed protein product [Gemmata massiliana]|uniref:Uncharacterized protein n=1 Tax=Gemmata massiliana TaxID=1210884 RepID=A0A6P2CWG2_9BACT|nr:hypothetical protein [Gemmata massiliana]VTR93321.1 unnamed protein product [Gemmata massiliana]